MKKGCVGSSLAQYIIIIAVILGAIIPLFFMIGGNLNFTFSQYSKMFGDMAITTKDNLDSQNLHDLTEGELSVTCIDSKCDFTVGDIVIEGIPDDFVNIVETSGSSAATDALVSILDQLAESFEQANLPEKAEEIKQLANMGHDIARLEKELSEYDCKLSDTICLGAINKELTSLDSEFKDSLSGFSSQLSLVMASLGDNEKLKAIIEQPSNEILYLGNTVSEIVDDNTHGSVYTWKSALKDYDKISTVTDIDSAIICAAGQADDNGYDCD